MSDRKTVALVALAAAMFCAYGYFAIGLVMLPDFHLYTAGGVGLYPSPGGRLLGAAGETVFAIVSIASVAAIVALAAIAAADNGCPAWWGAAAMAGSPAILWFAYAGIDPIGVALLAGGITLARRARVLEGSSPRAGVARIAALGAVAGAALVHLSLVPFALLLLPRSTWQARLALGTVAMVTIAALLTTPYSGVLLGALSIDALQAIALAAVAAIVLSLPGALMSDAFHDPLWRRAALIGVAECAAQHHLQVRYLLPAAAIAAMSVTRYPVLNRAGPPATATRPTTDAMTARRGYSPG